MKTLSGLLLFSLILATSVSAQKKIQPFVLNDAFTYGEKLKYTLAYNLYFNINVAELTLEVKPTPKFLAGKNNYWITAEGKSYSFYNTFFPVSDRYESIIDPSTFWPVASIRIVNEGNYHFTDHYIFDHTKRTVKTKRGKVLTVPYLTQDILSAIYLARTFDYSKSKVGDSFMMNVFIDDSTYYLGVKYMGKEAIKLKNTTYNCIKLQPILVVDRVFKSEDGMMLWVSDDKNKIPIKVFSGIKVGAVTAYLISYSGLKYKLNIKS